MVCQKYPQIQHVVVYTQKRGETQLHTISVSETAKALGFSRFLVNVAYMEKILFSYDLDGLGGIRSTQPTIRKELCAEYPRPVRASD